MDIRRGLGNRLHGDRPAHSGVLQGCARIPMSAMIDSPRDRAARRPRKSEASQRYDSPRGFMFHKQARQESNLQPPVLETGALPIELRTYELDAQTHTRVDAQENL